MRVIGQRPTDGEVTNVGGVGDARLARRTGRLHAEIGECRLEELEAGDVHPVDNWADDGVVHPGQERGVDRSAHGVPERKLEQLAEPAAGIFDDGQLVDDVRRSFAFPERKSCFDEVGAVGEVPVEAAFRHVEPASQPFDGNRVDTARGDLVDGRTAPLLARKRLARRHHHTVPNGDEHTDAYGECRPVSRRHGRRRRSARRMGGRVDGFTRICELSVPISACVAHSSSAGRPGNADCELSVSFPAQYRLRPLRSHFAGNRRGGPLTYAPNGSRRWTSAVGCARRRPATRARPARYVRATSLPVR